MYLLAADTVIVCIKLAAIPWVSTINGGSASSSYGFTVFEWCFRGRGTPRCRRDTVNTIPSNTFVSPSTTDQVRSFTWIQRVIVRASMRIRIVLTLKRE